jgi:hypothetical protein
MPKIEMVEKIRRNYNCHRTQNSLIFPGKWIIHVVGAMVGTALRMSHLVGRAQHIVNIISSRAVAESITAW